jgi:hypothetical protein
MTPIEGKGTPKFFHNLGTSGNWVELRLIGAAGRTNLNAVGSKVTLTTRGGKRLIRTIAGGTSIYGASSRIVHFGLGSEKIAEVEVRWPGGNVQRFGNLPENKLLTLVEGQNKHTTEQAYEAAARKK